MPKRMELWFLPTLEGGRDEQTDSGRTPRFGVNKGRFTLIIIASLYVSPK